MNGQPAPGPEEANEGRHRASPAVPSGPGTAGTFGREDGGAGRPSATALAREHEAARMRAKLMDPETALHELAERLTFAHVNAGKLPLGVLSEAVHYSKGTLSKVFAGKMLPSWPLVEHLADVLQVPTETVLREWFHLWTAANTLRRKPGVARETATVLPAPGTAATSGTPHPCRECGSLVLDPARHELWHRQIREAGGGPPGSVGGWAVQARAVDLHGSLRK